MRSGDRAQPCKNQQTSFGAGGGASNRQGSRNTERLTFTWPGEGVECSPSPQRAGEGAFPSGHRSGAGPQHWRGEPKEAGGGCQGLEGRPLGPEGGLQQTEEQADGPQMVGGAQVLSSGPQELEGAAGEGSWALRVQAH